MGITFNSAELLGPLGLVAFLLLCFAAMIPWIKSLIAAQTATQDARINALSDQLAHCQSQHDSTMAQIVALSAENGYLRGRIEALEGRDK